MTMFSTGTLSMVRHATAGIFVHTYTRTPRIESTTEFNDWNEPVTTPGTPVPNQPCLYQDAGPAPIIRADEQIALTLPHMFVPGSDPLVEGDTISDVIDKSGRVLFAGPVVVQAMTSVGDLDSAGAVMRLVMLRGVEVVQ